MNNFDVDFSFLGVIGPMIVDEIEKYTRETNRADDVHYLKISHIGKLIFRSLLPLFHCLPRWA